MALLAWLGPAGGGQLAGQLAPVQRQRAPQQLGHARFGQDRVVGQCFAAQGRQQGVGPGLALHGIGLLQARQCLSDGGSLHARLLCHAVQQLVEQGQPVGRARPLGRMQRRLRVLLQGRTQAGCFLLGQGQGLGRGLLGTGQLGGPQQILGHGMALGQMLQAVGASRIGQPGGGQLNGSDMAHTRRAFGLGNQMDAHRVLPVLALPVAAGLALISSCQRS